MTRNERLNLAASRYGLTDPSPDDVLSEAWPLYDAGDAIHIKGYHKDFSAVVRIVERNEKKRDPLACKTCAKPIPDASNRNTRYCSEECRYGRVADRGSRVGKPRAKAFEGELLERCVAIYRAGFSVEHTAARMECGLDKVRATLDAAGVKRRGLRGPTTKTINVGRNAA